MPRSYPPEFRRKVLDLIAAGRTVAAISADLGVSGQTIYTWRNQDRVDRGVRPGVTSTEQAELAKARRRIAELETELAATKRANELLKQVVPPKDRFEAIAKMAEEGHQAEVSCRVLSVSDSGFYAWRSRAPSARAIRHAWLTDVITQVRTSSNSARAATLPRARTLFGSRCSISRISRHGTHESLRVRGLCFLLASHLPRRERQIGAGGSRHATRSPGRPPVTPFDLWTLSAGASGIRS